MYTSVRVRRSLAAVGAMVLSLLLFAATPASALTYKLGIQVLVPNGAYSVWATWSDIDGFGTYSKCTQNVTGASKWILATYTGLTGYVPNGSVASAVTFTSTNCTSGYLKGTSGVVPNDGLTYFYLNNT